VLDAVPAYSQPTKPAHGQAAILNQMETVNSTTNPAATAP